MSKIRLLEVRCEKCGKSFFVRKRRGTWFHSATGGVRMCPYCGNEFLYVPLFPHYEAKHDKELPYINSRKSYEKSKV